MVSLRWAKPLALLLTLAGAAAGLGSWALVWFSIELTPGAALAIGVDVTGETAAPALSALSLAVLALTAALAIAKTVLRVILAFVEIAIGVAMGISAVVALADPLSASLPAIATATGLEGSVAADALVASLTVTPWPYLAIIGAIIVVAAGVLVVITARRWPGASQRFEATPPSTPQSGQSAPSASTVSDWDSLSAGDDPTGTTDAR